jgi:alpha-tubulin suppressor-like RCC1 family protein
MSGTRQRRWIRWRARAAAGGQWLGAVMIAVFGATALVASVAAASAATPGGVPYAFGANDSGELGSASNIGTANANPTPTPVALPAGVGAVTEIAGGLSPQGRGYSLAVSASGGLYAFGDNQYGELGIATNSGSDVSNPTPTVVTLPGQDGAVMQVAAGGGYSLVLTATGQLYGFGNNDSGELGSTSNNGTFNANPTPTLVGLPGQNGAVTQIAAGYDHSLVVTSTGQLYAFGYNGDGDLGNATNDGADVANPTPTSVSLPGQVGPVTHVAAGGFQSLVITASGQLYSFGQNEYGELGLAANSGTYDANPTPTLVTLPGATGTVAQIATGYSHSLAVTSTGQLYAFGDNDYGQLGNDTGNGTTTANATPTQVTLPGQNGAITQIAAGYFHSLAVTASGQLYAFGDNDDGQLGNDTDIDSDTANPTPTLVSFPTGMTVDSVAEGPTASHTLAIVSGPVTAPAPAPPAAPQPPAVSPSPPKRSTPAAAARPPAVWRITQSHSRWRAGKREATITDGRMPPVGTTFALSLDRPARVSFSFAQLLAGRRVKGRCTPQTRQSRHDSVCTRAVTLATLSFRGRRGRNTFFFSGRISSAKTLRPGRYMVIISAANSVGRSKSHSLAFTIVP